MNKQAAGQDKKGNNWKCRLAEKRQNQRSKKNDRSENIQPQTEIPFLAEQSAKSRKSAWKILGNTWKRTEKEKYIYILVDIFFSNLLYFLSGYGIISESGGKSQKKPQSGAESEVTALLTGHNKHSIDAKGRVIIPAKLKEQLGTVITILKGDDNCLRLYSETEWAKYAEKISQLPPTKNRALIRYIYSNAIEVIPDAQGRVILPPEMISFAGIQRDVMILGCGLYAEIWAYEIWEENNMEEPPEDMRGQMEDLGL